MLFFSNFKSTLLNYIKFIPVLSRHKFPSSYYIFRTSASLRSINKASLITRVYQTTPQTLKVEFSDALSTDLHYVWLRDSCRCRKCVHPISQQKLFDTTSIKLDVAPKFCHVTEKGELKIVWFEEDDEHISLYDPYWLHRYAMGFEKDLYEIVHDIVPPSECWTKKILEENLPEVEYKEVMQSFTALYHSLEKIHKYGILFVRNVPCVPGEVVNVMNRIAHIKETRWGSSFHITTDYRFHNPACITQIEKVKSLHTDMDYLEKSPGIQATHCLEAKYDINNETCGKKLSKQLYFGDGFYVAEWLKRTHPLYFNILASVPVKFRLLTRNMEYFNYQPILKLNRSRNVSEVHFNNSMMAPLEGPSKYILDFYTAYKLFGENIQESKNLYSFSYKPGDMVVLNNRRVLHGGYDVRFSKMERHLEGCFADLDEVLARYRSFLMRKRVNAEK